MVSLKSKEMTVNGTLWIPIKEFKVWFQTPFGLLDNYEAAINRCKEGDLDPDLCILPVPVAISVRDTYEIIQRH